MSDWAAAGHSLEETEAEIQRLAHVSHVPPFSLASAGSCHPVFRTLFLPQWYTLITQWLPVGCGTVPCTYLLRAHRHVANHGSGLTDRPATLCVCYECMCFVLQMADAVADKAEGLVRFCLIAVDTNGAREALTAKAHELRTALLDWVAMSWDADNLATVTKCVICVLTAEM